MRPDSLNLLTFDLHFYINSTLLLCIFNNGPRQKHDEQTTSSKIYPKPTLVLLSAGVACIVIGLSLYIMYFIDTHSLSQKSTEETTDFYALFRPKFDELRYKFPTQSERFWRIIGSPVRRIFKTVENSEAPATLLLGVPFNGKITARCLSRKLIENINSVYSNRAQFYIDVNDILQPSLAGTKLELDKHLQTVLSSGKGVVLDHLEKLPPESALLLHGYCDGSYAPFKMSVIVLIFYTNTNFESLNDRTFEDHLTDLWEKGLGPDEMPALRARIANSVAIVKPEANVVC
jgi:hypothetical protein